MNQRQMLGIGLAVLAGGLGVTAPASAAPRTPVAWTSCPTYSDAALQAMAPPDQLDRFRTNLARLECGTINVPLDHARPHGRQITVALTRIKARDQRHRLGSLALNPGGPGGSGYLMPVQLLTLGSADGIDQRYDLIGFDPRGVGYSTSMDCPPPQGEPDEDQVGPVTEEAARRRYDSEVGANAACGRSDPAFLGSLTTENVSHDLDRIRAALGERTMSFLGVSWGTWLGVVYRDRHPAGAGRMFLDSVAIPRFNLVDFADGRAAAAERNARRMTEWIADHHDRYGLGRTPAQVRTTIIELRSDFDAHPRRFTDLPIPLDGEFIAVSASQPASVWPLASQVLEELRDATGPTAPPTVKEVIGEPPSGPPSEPPADLPEQSNRTMNHAAFCNEDTSRLGFDAAWAVYQRRLADNPMTGRTEGFSAGCAGWPLPVQPVHLRRGQSSLVLSGHRYETPSPYEWTPEMRATVGGKVYTVDDDIHGSVLQVPQCAADVVSYFDSGRIDSGCAGVPTPAEPTRATTLFAGGEDPRARLGHKLVHPGPWLFGSDSLE